MFEKEAEEIANKKLCSERICYNHCNFNSPKHHRCGEWHRIYECAKESAEFGYNKANEWHKIADGDIPKVTGDYITNIGVLTYDHYGNNIYKWHTPFCEACDYGDEVDDDEVIAWCEIPKYTKEIKENGNTEV